MYTLITAANSSEAYSLKNALNAADVLLGDYLELPDVLVRSGKVLQLPDPGNIAYIHQMLALCLDKQVTTIYPLREQEKHLLLDAKQLFYEYGVQIKIPGDKI